MNPITFKVKPDFEETIKRQKQVAITIVMLALLVGGLIVGISKGLPINRTFFPVLIFVFIIWVFITIFSKLGGLSASTKNIIPVELVFDSEAKRIEKIFASEKYSILLNEINILKVLRNRNKQVKKLWLKGAQNSMYIYEFEDMDRLLQELKKLMSPSKFEETNFLYPAFNSPLIVIVVVGFLPLIAKQVGLNLPAGSSLIFQGAFFVFLKPFKRLFGAQYERSDFRIGVMFLIFGFWELAKHWH